MLELWMILALGTALSWAILDVTDKYVLDKFVKNPFVIIVISGIVSLFFGLGVFIFQFQAITLYELFICLMIAFTNLLFVAAYLKAFQIEEVSRVVPMFQVSVLFVVIMAFLFLGERLTLMQYAGSLLLMLGAVLISLRKNIVFSKGAMLGLAAAFFSAVNFVLFGYVEATVSYTSAFAYSRIFYFLMTILFFFWVKPDIAYSMKKGGKKFLFAAGFAEGINALGILFMAWAFSIGSVSLVNALIATEPFMVLAITVFLTLVFPSLIKEEIGKGTIIYKLIAILMIFAGVWLVS